MKTKLFFFGLALMLGISLPGCSSDDDDNKNVDVTGVTLAASKLSLKVGESTTLTLTFTPADATPQTSVYRWSFYSESGDRFTEYATAEIAKDGNTVSLKAIKAGIVYALFEYGDFKTETLKITITE
jgi:uncharacterized protein YjdB